MKDNSTLHRLYRIGVSRYVQHDGVSPLPAEVQVYARAHSGESPAYIPLPLGPIEFDVGYGSGVMWDGHGSLPGEVLEYVIEHGTLPYRRFGTSIESEMAV